MPGVQLDRVLLQVERPLGEPKSRKKDVPLIEEEDWIWSRKSGMIQRAPFTLFSSGALNKKITKNANDKLGGLNPSQATELVDLIKERNEARKAEFYVKYKSASSRSKVSPIKFSSHSPIKLMPNH